MDEQSAAKLYLSCWHDGEEDGLWKLEPGKPQLSSLSAEDDESPTWERVQRRGAEMFGTKQKVVFAQFPACGRCKGAVLKIEKDDDYHDEFPPAGEAQIKADEEA